MSARFQLVIDCADPDRLTRFWATALGYQVQPPPAGFDSWRTYWLGVGVPAEELDDGDDSLVDPDGAGPRIWFQKVPEGKVVKNRLHLDIGASGGRTVPLVTRKERVVAEAARLTAGGGDPDAGARGGGVGPLRGGHAGSRGQRVLYSLAS